MSSSYKEDDIAIQLAVETLQTMFRRWRDCKSHIKYRKITSTQNLVLNLAAETITSSLRKIASKTKLKKLNLSSTVENTNKTVTNNINVTDDHSQLILDIPISINTIDKENHNVINIQHNLINLHDDSFNNAMEINNNSHNENHLYNNNSIQITCIKLDKVDNVIWKNKNDLYCILSLNCWEYQLDTIEQAGDHAIWENIAICLPLKSHIISNTSDNNNIIVPHGKDDLQVNDILMIKVLHRNLAIKDKLIGEIDISLSDYISSQSCPNEIFTMQDEFFELSALGRKKNKPRGSISLTFVCSGELFNSNEYYKYKQQQSLENIHQQNNSNSHISQTKLLQAEEILDFAEDKVHYDQKAIKSSSSHNKQYYVAPKDTSKPTESTVVSLTIISNTTNNTTTTNNNNNNNHVSNKPNINVTDKFMKTLHTATRPNTATGATTNTYNNIKIQRILKPSMDPHSSIAKTKTTDILSDISNNDKYNLNNNSKPTTTIRTKSANGIYRGSSIISSTQIANQHIAQDHQQKNQSIKYKTELLHRRGNLVYDEAFNLAIKKHASIIKLTLTEFATILYKLDVPIRDNFVFIDDSLQQQQYGKQKLRCNDGMISCVELPLVHTMSLAATISFLIKDHNMIDISKIQSINNNINNNNTLTALSTNYSNYFISEFQSDRILSYIINLLEGSYTDIKGLFLVACNEIKTFDPIHYNKANLKDVTIKSNTDNNTNNNQTIINTNIEKGRPSIWSTQSINALLKLLKISSKLKTLDTISFNDLMELDRNKLKLDYGITSSICLIRFEIYHHIIELIEQWWDRGLRPQDIYNNANNNNNINNSIDNKDKKEKKISKRRKSIINNWGENIMIPTILEDIHTKTIKDITKYEKEYNIKKYHTYGYASFEYYLEIMSFNKLLEAITSLNRAFGWNYSMDSLVQFTSIVGGMFGYIFKLAHIDDNNSKRQYQLSPTKGNKKHGLNQDSHNNNINNIAHNCNWILLQKLSSANIKCLLELLSLYPMLSIDLIRHLTKENEFIVYIPTSCLRLITNISIFNSKPIDIFQHLIDGIIDKKDVILGTYVAVARVDALERILQRYDWWDRPTKAITKSLSNQIGEIISLSELHSKGRVGIKLVNDSNICDALPIEALRICSEEEIQSILLKKNDNTIQLKSKPTIEITTTNTTSTYMRNKDKNEDELIDSTNKILTKNIKTNKNKKDMKDNENKSKLNNMLTRINVLRNKIKNNSDEKLSSNQIKKNIDTYSNDNNVVSNKVLSDVQHQTNSILSNLSHVDIEPNVSLLTIQPIMNNIIDKNLDNNNKYLRSKYTNNDLFNNTNPTNGDENMNSTDEHVRILETDSNSIISNSHITTNNINEIKDYSWLKPNHLLLSDSYDFLVDYDTIKEMGKNDLRNHSSSNAITTTNNNSTIVYNNSPVKSIRINMNTMSPNRNTEILHQQANLNQNIQLNKNDKREYINLVQMSFESINPPSTIINQNEAISFHTKIVRPKSSNKINKSMKYNNILSEEDHIKTNQQQYNPEINTSFGLSGVGYNQNDKILKNQPNNWNNQNIPMNNNNHQLNNDSNNNNKRKKQINPLLELNNSNNKTKTLSDYYKKPINNINNLSSKVSTNTFDLNISNTKSTINIPVKQVHPNINQGITNKTKKNDMNIVAKKNEDIINNNNNHNDNNINNNEEIDKNNVFKIDINNTNSNNNNSNNINNNNNNNKTRIQQLKQIEIAKSLKESKRKENILLKELKRLGVTVPISTTTESLM